MTEENLTLLTRPVIDQDHHRLVNLIHFESHVHRHLDWLAPLDWMDHTPFLVAERKGRLSAALSIPEDPPQVAWVRLFAAVSELDACQAWKLMWPAALAALRHKGDGGSLPQIAALPLAPWFESLLTDSGFRKLTDVVFLTWQNTRRPTMPLASSVHVRPMRIDDLSAVERVDWAAFDPIWRNSAISLEAALRQSAVSTVAELDGQIVGYQISTAGHMGGHLARLAVLPTWQGHDIGKLILLDLLQQFDARGVRRVSVNTQANNPTSLHLYAKLGFVSTGENYPVYCFQEE